MELSKFEQMVLGRGYVKKCRWHYLYLGFVFIAVGAVIWGYGYKTLPQYTEIWDRSAHAMERTQPASPKDQHLQDIAIGNMQMAKEGWINFMKERTNTLTLIFLAVGIYLVMAYFRELRYRKLLLKSNLVSQQD